MSDKPSTKRVWFYPAKELAGRWIGVPSCRPPVWFGGDEFGRPTIVFQLPGVGCMVVRIRNRAASDSEVAG